MDPLSMDIKYTNDQLLAVKQMAKAMINKAYIDHEQRVAQLEAIMEKVDETLIERYKRGLDVQ